MKANYHTHTWRCGHASGEEKEYVEKAIAGGLKVLGFSDHTPYPFPDGHSSGFRMSLKQFEEYVTTVLALRDEYKNDIAIHLGVEAEYYPAYFDALLRFVSDYPLEYFLLGQHYLENEIGAVSGAWATADESVIRRYCEQTKEAMATGSFTYFAHPDMIHYIGSSEVYDRYVREICRNAKQFDMPLEINFLGLYEGRHYPNRRFWKIAGEEGCKVIFGADAHRPEAVWRPEVTAMAERMVQEYALKLVEDVKLRRPF